MPQNKIEYETLPVEVKFQDPTSGVVSGIAATYGTNPDGVGDVIQAGAFTDSLAQIATEGRKLKILHQHNPDQVVGVWNKVTDGPDSLKVEGQLTLDASDAKDVWAKLKSGALDALSIGYRTKSADPRPSGGRVLTDVELVEISIVTFPANKRAVVTDVKAETPPTEAQKAATQEAEKMATENAPELGAEVKKLEDRIGDLEAKAANTNAAPKAANTNRPPEAKAFANYARLGEGKLGADEFKALQSSTDTAGGFLVPEDFRAELIKTVTETSPMRQYARITNTGREELTMPKRVTKLAGGWTAELADQTESEPTYGQIKIPVHELSVFTSISNQNLEDSAFNMEAELTADFGESFGEIESAAFILGDGAGKPTGILNNADIPVQATGAAGVVDADDLIDCFYKLKGSYRNRGAWMMNADMLAEVRKLKTANGDYIWRESIADGSPATILGRPVVEAPDMPAPAAGSKAIIFGDYNRAYRIVSRLDIAVLRDPYTLATKSAVKFHARQRVGGDTVLPEAARVIQLA